MTGAGPGAARAELRSPSPEAAGRDRRVTDPALQPAPALTFTFDGNPVRAYRGETIAAALAASGIVTFGRRRDGTPRGRWCGMGVCQECIVEVDGVPGVRACMAEVLPDAVVKAQGYASTLPAEPAAAGSASASPAAPPTHRPQVLVVGAGPGGLAAARAAALCGATVTVLDERATPGGQFFKQVAKSHSVVAPEHLDAQARAGRSLVAEVKALGVDVASNAAVWGAFGPQELAACIDGTQHVFAAERVVIATGVFERAVPLPGWLLPGCMTTGAAQTLLRAYRVVPGQRVLVAGNGPLNLQLAAELVAAGVEVVAVVEAAARPGLRTLSALARAVRNSPALIRDGLRYRMRLWRAGVPLHFGSAVVSVHGDGRVGSCTIARIDAEGRPIAGSSRRIEVDAVCMGHGFLPSNEIPRALGCRHAVRGPAETLSTVVDAEGMTSVPGVYVVGDVVELAGAHAARCQGFIAGCAVARSLDLAMPVAVVRERAAAARALRRHRAFQQALWRLFAAPVLRLQFAAPGTIACRCEGVSCAEIRAAIDAGAATLGAVKRRTRAGMGRCQGRGCESLVAAMMPGAARDELSGLAPRAPVKPVRIADLLR